MLNIFETVLCHTNVELVTKMTSNFVDRGTLVTITPIRIRIDPAVAAVILDVNINAVLVENIF